MVPIRSALREPPIVFILSKYILQEYLKILVLCLATLLLVYLTVDIFGKIGRMVQEDAALATIFLYYALRIPKIIFDVAPIGVLISTLVVLGILSRHNEIVAMKSNGISLFFVTSPLLVLAFLLSVILSAANFSFIPLTKQKADFVRAVKIRKGEERAYFGQTRLWLRDGRHTFLNIGFADSIHRVLHDVTLYRLRDNFTLEESIEAKRISFEGGVWMMYDGRVRQFPQEGVMTVREFEKEPAGLERKPEEFKGLDVDTDMMKFPELRRYISRLTKDGYDVDRFRVDLYSKLTLPFASFLMSLIAIPFGVVQSRSRGIARGVGISLLIGTCYWIVHSVSLSMGHAGLISPLLASSLPNMLFLAVGLYLYIGIRQ
jgi:lipopolysaccharide export system permease protein